MTARHTTILSHHATTDGRVTYVRAPDGGLEVWLEPTVGAPHLVGRGHGGTTTDGVASRPVGRASCDA